jgi:hypothetical protein
MNLFELSKFLSPVGGAVGGVVAVHRTPNPTWIWLAIPLGLAFGIGCFRGLLRLAIGSHGKNPDLPAWRAAAVLSVGFAAPYVAGLLAFLLVRVILYVWLPAY